MNVRNVVKSIRPATISSASNIRPGYFENMPAGAVAFQWRDIFSEQEIVNAIKAAGFKVRCTKKAKTSKTVIGGKTWTSTSPTCYSLVGDEKFSGFSTHVNPTHTTVIIWLHKV